MQSWISVVFLLPILLIQSKKSGLPILPKDRSARQKLLLTGALCGVFLTLSVNLQQFGLMFYPDGVAAAARGGFLTSLYVVLVPLFSFLFTKKLRLQVIPAVLLALVGVYLLCISDRIDGIYLGDIFVLLCALSFTFHILTVDHMAGEINGFLLSTIQFFICAVLSGILSLFLETPEWNLIPTAIPQLLYMGIFSSGIGYSLQIIGQKYAEPTVASLSMSLEGVFAALGGWLIASDVLTLREIVGCVLVFAAIVLAQLPSKKQKI